MIKLSGSMIIPTFKSNKTFNSSISKKTLKAFNDAKAEAEAKKKDL